MNEKIEFLILNKKSDLIEYEKGLFKAYREITFSKWRDKNYKIIYNDRYQSIIPYNDQMIFAVKINSKIIMALSANINISNFFVLKKLGFKIEETDYSKICEGLDFFHLFYRAFNFFNYIEKLYNFAMDKLKRNGFKTIYGSCEERLIILYKKAGFQKVDEIIIDEKKEYLIKREL